MEESKSLDFIRTIISEDIQLKKHGGEITTRFPPEPNGYLHIGHAKSISLNFGIAKEYNGRCNLRFDDTNPIKENIEYVESIKKDIRWLGFNWEDRLFYASDYFEKIYEYAVRLIKEGKAYVDSLSADQIRAYRGTLTEPGRDSPHRNRSVEENLELFQRMRAGDFPDGSHVLRAKIDMSSGNLNLRDPTLYRIRHVIHHRTGNQWVIYPMYDFTHALSDSFEQVTHSLCTLEFEDHRPLYNWSVQETHASFTPRQIEFARLNLTYTVLSKRKLLRLVDEGYVSGWDDPRMPTISGLRRRGYTPRSIINFCNRIGLAKRDSIVEIAQLEHAVREDLNKIAPRFMAVLNPLRVVINNYPEEDGDELEAINNPEDENAGTRKIPFSRIIYIEAEDFMENPPKKFFRLSPGREVRLRYAYLITCTSVVKDQDGNIVEVQCEYDPKTRGGTAPDGRRVKGTLHWVSAPHSLNAEVRMYDRLFKTENPEKAPEGKDFMYNLNSDSLELRRNAKVECNLKKVPPETNVQFERQGYFVLDADSTSDNLVFNRTVSLKDTWAKIKARENN